MNRNGAAVLLLSALVVACGPAADAPPATAPALEVVDATLARVREDFNAHRGRVRQLYIVGPSCGICLRGMADLDEALLRDHRDDLRMHTLVVHVPTLGATVEHARDSVPLLAGPRISHYWEDTGVIGQRLQSVLGFDFYAWDVWLAYGPDAEWHGDVPPSPDYWEHQLGPLPSETRLDAVRFAARVKQMMATVGAPRAVPAQAAAREEVVIPDVAQPAAVALGEHIVGRGGYPRLKQIRRLSGQGEFVAGTRRYALTREAGRPDRLQLRLRDGAAESRVRVESGAVKLSGAPVDARVEQALAALLAGFEFDGLLVDWKDKGHRLAMDGMEKVGDRLAWRLDLGHRDGTQWALLVDSHSGDLLSARRTDGSEAAGWSLRSADFRDVDGVRVPFALSYVDPDGRVVGTERFARIELASSGR